VNSGESYPGIVINGNVHVFPANARRSLAAITRDPVADNPNFAQFFDVEVKQISRRVMLIALDGCSRLDRVQPI
jgi:hypothetical protein